MPTIKKKSAGSARRNKIIALSLVTALSVALSINFAAAAPLLSALCKSVGSFVASLTFSASSPQNGQTLSSYNDPFAAALSLQLSPLTPDNSTLQIGSGSAWDIETAPDDTETPTEFPPLPTPSEEILDAIPYPENIEDHDGIITDVHYGVYDSPAYVNLKNGGQVRNCTSLDNSTVTEAEQNGVPFSIDKESSLPQVLVYHTHTTESFEPYARDFYDKDFSSKTTDIKKNMVAVGNKICEELEKAGISVLHDTTVHDYPSYNGSYQSSRETVSEILREYPTIKVVLDVHRDAIEKDDGTRLRPIAEIDGKNAAQIMIISCCDDASGRLPDYMSNLSFACALQSRLESDWEGITRPVLFDYRFYNQDLSTGALLIEIGSHANSLDEALYSASLLGKSLSCLL